MSIQIPPDSTGKTVDSLPLANGERQIIGVGDPGAVAAMAKVTNAVPGATDYGLVTRRAPKGLTLASFNFSSNADQALAPATPGKVNKIWKLWFNVDGNCAYSLKDGATVKVGPIGLAQGGELKWDYDDEPWLVTAAGQAFALNLSLAVQCGGIIGYTQE